MSSRRGASMSRAASKRSVAGSTGSTPKSSPARSASGETTGSGSPRKRSASSRAASSRRTQQADKRKAASLSQRAQIEASQAKKAASGGRRDAGEQARGGSGKSKKKGRRRKKKRRTGKSALKVLMSALGITYESVDVTDPQALEAIELLGLSQAHLKKLKLSFDLIDLDGSGSIDLDEFFEAIGEVRSPFTDALFAMIDADESGTIEFEEYIRVLATYCIFTREEILRFCFECFDKDGSGTIDEKEFMELCRTVNNAAPMFPGNFQKALEEFDVNDDGLIDFGEFMEIDRRYPLVLFPAFRLQDAMQRCTLGEKAWLRILELYRWKKNVEEYRNEHGGQEPTNMPPPPSVQGGLLFCCA